jgi:hypothetical protein
VDTSAERSLTYSVFVTNWEIECCGVPPAVGDEVCWTLELRGPEELTPSWPAEVMTRVPAQTPEPLASGGGSLVRIGALSASVEGSAHPAEGLLCEAHHTIAPDVPATTGLVERVELAACQYSLGEDRCWRPVSGSLTLSPLQRSPAHFSFPRGETTTGELGVLVSLRLLPSSTSRAVRAA